MNFRRNFYRENAEYLPLPELWRVRISTGIQFTLSYCLVPIQGNTQ